MNLAQFSPYPPKLHEACEAVPLYTVTVHNNHSDANS